jgi:hypothetical protein
MALTALEVQLLTEKGFDQLFEDHKVLWKEKAAEAYTYTAKFVTPTGQPVRPDDVLPILVPALELSPEFSGYLDNKRLKQKYWRIYFGDFVLDRLWEELSRKEEETDD